MHRSSGPGARAYPGRVSRTYEVRTYGCQMNVHDSAGWACVEVHPRTRFCCGASNEQSRAYVAP